MGLAAVPYGRIAKLLFPQNRRDRSAASVEAEVEAKETARIINNFLGTLDQRNRVLFVRRYWHSDTIEDLADLFHTSKHNISVRLSRIRKALRKHLIKEGVSL